MLQRSTLVMVVCVAAGVAASAAVAVDTRVVADVGGRPVLAADVVDRLTAVRRESAAQGRLDAFTSGAKDAALKTLVDTRLLALGARGEGLDRRPEVKRRLDDLVDGFLAEQLLAEIAGRTDVSEGVRREYYAAHPEAFQLPPRVRARHIVVKTEAEAVALLGRLKRHADFGQLAAEHNIDATRKAAGELGWTARGVMVPPFEAALFGLRPGAISGVVQTPFGFHIVQAEDIEAPKQKTFEAVSDEIRARLVQQQVDAVKADLASKHTVRVNTDVLRSIR